MKLLLSRYIQPSIAFILSAWIILGIAGCHANNKKYLPIGNEFCSAEDMALSSFHNYLHVISSPDLPLGSFSTDLGLHENPLYIKRVQYDKNLQLFPAVLWQIYALTGETEWKRMAENYTAVIHQEDIVTKLVDTEEILHVYRSRYSVEGGANDRSLLLKSLSRYLIKSEANSELHGGSNPTLCIERLLENELLFFASRETGDPVFARLAQKNSEYIYKHYFQNKDFNELYYKLANGKTDPSAYMLDQLSSQDFYHLSIIFYGFTILDSQQKNERYHLLCLRLANLFVSIFENADTEYDSVQTHQGSIAGKVDALSRTLTCLAFNKLSDTAGKQYQEIATRTVCHTLEKMSQSDDDQYRQYSSSLFYNLFAFFNQNDLL